MFILVYQFYGESCTIFLHCHYWERGRVCGMEAEVAKQRRVAYCIADGRFCAALSTSNNKLSTLVGHPGMMTFVKCLKRLTASQKCVEQDHFSYFWPLSENALWLQKFFLILVYRRFYLNEVVFLDVSVASSMSYV